MGVSVRYFVVEDGTERLLRLPAARWRRWLYGEETAPEYAGCAVRVIEVICGTKDGRVETVGRVLPLKVRFLADGRLDRDRHQRLMVAKLNLNPLVGAEPHRPLDLMPRVRRRQFEEKTAFKLTAAHTRALHEALAGPA